MPTLNDTNRDITFPVGAKASIVLNGYAGSCYVTHCTVIEHLKNAVRVKDDDGRERLFMLTYGYERGTSKEWHKPYLYDHKDGLRIEAQHAERNAAKARAQRRAASLEELTKYAARMDEEAFKAALAKLNAEEGQP